MKNKKTWIIALSSALLVIAIILIVVFTVPRKKTISFMVDDEAYSTIDTKGEEILELPSNPYKEGYTFEGWFSDETFKTVFTEESLVDTKLKDDMYVYAYFLKKNGIEGTNVEIDGFESKEVTGVGKALYLGLDNSHTNIDLKSIIKVSPKASYKLTTDKEGKNSIDSNNIELNVGKNVMYLHITDRHGEKKTYTVVINKLDMFTITFNTNGGSSVTSCEVEEGKKLTTVPTSTKDGYTFTGWDYDFNNPITKDLTVNAIFEANEYELTLNYGYEGIDNKTSKIKFDSKTTLETPVRSGYTFTGWYDGETKVDNSYTHITLGNKTLTAHWSKNDYTITLDVNGGNALESNTIGVEYLATFTLPTPVRAGYTFTGWYDGDAKVEGGSYTKTENLSLKAKWDLITYSITYNLNDGSLEKANKATYNVEDSKFTLNNPTKAGYDFAGWVIGEDAAIKTLEIDPAWVKDLTITATWTKHTYTITLDVNGGSALESNTIDVEYLATFTLPTITKEGYIFTGWYNGETKVEGGSYNYTENLSLVASFIKDEVTITLYVGEKKTVLPDKFKVNQEIYTLDPATSGDLDFLGYYSKDGVQYTDKLGKGIVKLPAVNSLELYAKFGYLVTLETNGGNKLTGLSLDQSKVLPDNLPTPTKDGMTFEGWSDTAGQENFVASGDVISGKTLYAKWKEEAPAHYFTYELDETNYNLAGTSYTGENLVIPTHIAGLPLGYVSGNSLNNLTNLKSIVIPVGNSVWLESGILRGCNNLEYIEVPYFGPSRNSEYNFGRLFGSVDKDGVVQENGNMYAIPSSIIKVHVTESKEIVPYSFANCTSIEEIIYDQEEVFVRDHAFLNCQRLIKYNPNKDFDVNILYKNGIWNNTFENCSSIYSIGVLNYDPNFHPTMEKDALKGCTSLSRFNSLVDGEFKTIKYMPFDNIDDLPMINKLTLDGVCINNIRGKISNMGNLHIIEILGQIDRTSDITLSEIFADVPYSVKEVIIKNTKDENKAINNNFFSGFNRIEAISFPDTITTIGDFAFYGLDRLSRINSDVENTYNFNKAVTAIGDDNFDGKENVYFINNIGGVLTKDLFAGCTNLLAFNNEPLFTKDELITRFNTLKTKMDGYPEDLGINALEAKINSANDNSQLLDCYKELLIIDAGTEDKLLDYKFDLRRELQAFAEEMKAGKPQEIQDAIDKIQDDVNFNIASIDICKDINDAINKAKQDITNLANKA